MHTQNTKNGKSNGHGESIEAAIRAELDRLRRPGRPSKEVRALREQLAQIDAKPRGKKAQALVLRHGDPPTEVVKPKRGKKTPGAEGEIGRRVIFIPPIEQEVIEVDIVGISDLIQHAWDPKTIRQMEDDQQKKVGDPVTKRRNARLPRDPKAEYTSARYIRGGKDCLPVVQFKKCMAAAASQIRGVTIKNINTAVFVKSTNPKDHNFAVIKYQGKEPELRTDMVKIGNFGNKKATPRYRPCYHGWSTTLRIEFDSGIISAEYIVNLLNRGGFGVGIAEWRPERGGAFGRFTVKAVRGIG